MQLNLQLLLAYLDDLLEPAEAAQVAELIEASETASNLLNRIRDVIRRLRLSAPAVSGSEMGLDPNTVAEYLDRTMPAERLADVEGVCLESDMHLAEAAACHQIVALALGEPAQVDMGSRRRMYTLGRAVEEAKPAPAAAAKTTRTPVVAKPEAKSLPAAPKNLPQPVVAVPREVPREAAREPIPASSPTRRTAQLAPEEALAAPAFTATLDWRDDPDDMPRPIAKPPRSRAHLFQRMAVAMTLAWFALATWPQISRWWEGAALISSTDDPYANLLIDDEQTEAANDKNRPIEVAAAPDAGHPPEGDIPPGGADEPPRLSTAGSGLFSGARGNLVVGNHAREHDAPPAPPAAVSQRHETGTQQVSFHLPQGSKDSARDVRPAIALRPVGASSKLPAAIVEVGHLVSTGQVLLRQGPDRGDWLMVSSGARLSSGDRVVAPPQFRPTIMLGDGLLVELPPETMVELLPPDADETPGLKVIFGRLVVRGHQRSRGLRVLAGQWQAKLAFEGETGSLALEVRPFRSTGTDPEKEATRSAVDLYAVRGRAFVDDGVSLGTLDAPSRTVISKLPGERVEAGGDTPAWSHAPETFTVEDLRATTIVSGRLVVGEPAAPALAKAAVDRQHPEVRQLASRWLGCLGEFQALVASLSDPDIRVGLREQSVRALRDGLSRGPEWATLVRVACRQTRGDAGEDRYRLLWGYTPEQLSEGGAERLLAGLDHNDLDVRALSFWNLQACTGQTLYYRPDQPAAQRRPSVERWRERLSRGQNAAD